MVLDLVDGAFDAVALELEKGLPDPRVHDLDVLIEQAALFLVGQEVLKNVEEGLVVDEFRGVVLVKLVEVERGPPALRPRPESVASLPELIEPRFQVPAVAGAVDLQIQFDVVVAAPRPRPRTVKLELPRMASSTPRWRCGTSCRGEAWACRTERISTFSRIHARTRGRRVSVAGGWQGAGLGLRG